MLQRYWCDFSLNSPLLDMFTFSFSILPPKLVCAAPGHSVYFQGCLLSCPACHGDTFKMVSSYCGAWLTWLPQQNRMQWTTISLWAFNRSYDSQPTCITVNGTPRFVPCTQSAGAYQDWQQKWKQDITNLPFAAKWIAPWAQSAHTKFITKWKKEITIRAYQVHNKMKKQITNFLFAAQWFVAWTQSACADQKSPTS